MKAFFNFESTVSFSGFSVIMKLQSHSSVCRSRRKLERGSEMYKTKTNHTLFHWKYLRCILTIAWNCSGSVSLILFPTSMAPTMVRHQIFPTSENNIGIGIGTVWVQAYWYWHGYLVTSVLIAICDMKFTRAQNQVSFTAAKLNLTDFTLSLSLARIGFPSSLSSSSAHRGSLTVA